MGAWSPALMTIYDGLGIQGGTVVPGGLVRAPRASGAASTRRCTGSAGRLTRLANRNGLGAGVGPPTANRKRDRTSATLDRQPGEKLPLKGALDGHPEAPTPHEAFYAISGGTQ